MVPSPEMSGICLLVVKQGSERKKARKGAETGS
jgi:hypothetical protein